MPRQTNATPTPSPAQRAVLTIAAAHPQGLAVSFPEALKGGARAKVLATLTQASWLVPTIDELALRISDAGYRAIGVEPPRTRKANANSSKQAQVIALLQRRGGATIEQLMTLTKWQAHSVRGFLSGQLRKKLGLPVVSSKEGQQARRYRIESEAAHAAA